MNRQKKPKVRNAERKLQELKTSNEVRKSKLDKILGGASLPDYQTHSDWYAKK